MTNEDKLREIFPKTIFVQYKESDKLTALVCSDEWLNAEYKEPFKPIVEIDLYSVIKQKYIEREVLDKIRAEIERLQKMCDKDDLNLMAQYSAFGMVLDILDKYKAESEADNRNDDNKD